MNSLWLPGRKAVAALALGIGASLIVLVLTPADSWPLGIAISLSLSWATLVDIDRKILPDAITIGLILIGLAGAWVMKDGSLADRTIGTLAGYSALAAVKFTYARLRGQEGLGLGDAKLFAAGGALLGWHPLPLVMILATLSALLLVSAKAWIRGAAINRNEALAFGPHIAGSIWLCWLVAQHARAASLNCT